MNRYRVPMRNGNGNSHAVGSAPSQGQLPLPNPNAEPFANRLERRCAEDPEFLKRLADAVRELGFEKGEKSN